MALATQCPHCQTSFRVANDQLKLYAGIVRCGTCKQTFNGIDHLLSVDDMPKTTPASSETQENTATETELSSAVASMPVEETSALPATEEKVIDAVPDKTPEQITIESEAELETAFSEPTQKLKESDNENSESKLETQEVTATKVEVEVEVKSKAETKTETYIENHEDSEVVVETHAESELFSLSESINEEVSANVVDEKHTEIIPEPISTEIEVIVATAVDNSFLNSQSALDPLLDNNKFEADLLEKTTDMIVVEEISLDSRSTLFPELSFSENEEEMLKAQTSLTTNQIIDNIDESLHALEVSCSINQKKSKTETEGETEAALEQASEIRTQVLDSFPEEDNEVAVNEETTIIESSSDQDIVEDHEEDAEEVNEEVNEEVSEEEIKPQFVIQAENKKRYGKWITAFYSVSILILIVSAFGVVSYHYRNNLYAHFPQTQPHLLSACKLLDCSINLLAEKGAITKESQELVMLSTNPNIMMLSVQLQNKSRTVQAWPMIELTLLDPRKKTLLQRVFKPTEYLVIKKEFGAGMPAQSEKNIDIHFKLGIEKASSYEVKIFYH